MMALTMVKIKSMINYTTIPKFYNTMGDNMLNFTVILECLKILTLAAVLFVWFVRYDNIIKEFSEYGYPAKLRDFVGILKISCVFMIQNDNPVIVELSSLLLGFLMFCAVVTHFRAKHKIIEYVPSFSLMCLSLVFFVTASL